MDVKHNCCNRPLKFVHVAALLDMESLFSQWTGKIVHLCLAKTVFGDSEGFIAIADGHVQVQLLNKAVRDLPLEHLVERV